MRDPVVAADGCTYERAAIAAWIARQQAGGQEQQADDERRSSVGSMCSAGSVGYWTATSGGGSSAAGSVYGGSARFSTASLDAALRRGGLGSAAGSPTASPHSGSPPQLSPTKRSNLGPQAPFAAASPTLPPAGSPAAAAAAAVVSAVLEATAAPPAAAYGFGYQRDPSAAAELAAAGAAAAAAAQQQLNAAEQQRRAAVAEAEARQAEEELAEVRSSLRHGYRQQLGSEGEGLIGVPEDAAAEAAAAAAEADGEKGEGPSRTTTEDSDELTLDDLSDLEGGTAKPWYKRWGFWLSALSFAASLAFFVAGIVMVVVSPDTRLARFSVWRWCFFLGCWPPIYWGTRLLMWGLTKFAECRLFTARTAVYFLVGVQGTRGAFLAVMRSSLVLATFAALFQSQPDKDGRVQDAFLVIIKVLGCVALCTLANLITKVIMKLMSTHFHKEAHFQRMQEALRKEYFLSVLCQPRTPRHSVAGGEALHRGRSFARRLLGSQIFSKSVAAMHTFPSMVKSFTAGHHLRQLGVEGQPSAQDSGVLLGEGSQLSDAELAAGTAGGYLDHAPSKSHGSASQALTSVSVVVNAGVEPSSRSAPNLLPPALRPEHTISFDARNGSTAAEAVQQLRQPSRLARMGHASKDAAAEAAVAWSASAGTSVCGRAGSGSPTRLQPQLSPQAAAIAAAAAAAAQPGLRPSLSSRHASFNMDPNAPPSFTFAQPAQAPAKQRSMASVQSGRSGRSGQPSGRGSGGVGASGKQAAPAIEELVDLNQAPQRRARRSTVIQMPPEELEKMHHIEKHIRKNQLKLTLVDQIGSLNKAGKGGGGGGASTINEQEARRVAYFMFHNIRASRKRHWIQQSDLEDFLPPKQAEEAFRYIDIDGNGRISAGEVRDSVLKIYQERAFLACTLRDTKSVIGKLERLLGAIIHVLFGFFYLYIFGVDVTKAWLTFSSVILAFTFIFGNSIRTVFECVVWLFSVHPYDVGDTLVIGGENHRVAEIALLNTTLVRADGARIYRPNSRLNNESLFNLSRSTNKAESIKLSLDLSTPLEVVEMLRGAVDAHVKANSAEFTGSSSVHVRALGDPMKLAISVWYEFCHNGVDGGRISRARTGLYIVIASALSAAGVQFTLPPFSAGTASEAEAIEEAKMAAALEAVDLAAGAGLPPINVTGLRLS
ncbi:Mechanosensitive ion channel 10 [Chlorella sorokiniana]|uniref:Mechanosensitive ion channel 10 n=1 Tax=Chlorella sorokiniana TaxID=3076 RepID=A0A2P6TJX5_CHLSO|nr:Mechanosensitive ion channel 10 [Chlorella sorokiniana]|eukprot:PRW44384.1 Mechanosensitive ion channel 10 [Chlorella sorokiniana]